VHLLLVLFPLREHLDEHSATQPRLAQVPSAHHSEVRVRLGTVRRGALHFLQRSGNLSENQVRIP